MSDKKRMQIVAVTKIDSDENAKSWWQKVGMGFENKDGSWNLVFNFLPANMATTTLQLRAIEPKTSKE